jgi:dienelactone hydrolase
MTMMRAHERLRHYLALGLLFALGCGGSPAPQMIEPLQTAGRSSQVVPPVGAAGMPARPPAAGSGVVVPSNPITPAGVAGMRAAAGSSAVAGASAAAGASAGAGAAGVSAVAGTGVSGAAAAGGGGATAPAETGAIVRGPDPTDESAAAPGPYKVSMYTTGFMPSPDFLAATIYYPMDTDPPYSIAVFCPGFTALQTDIAAWGPFMASNGIVLMTIDTNTTGDSVELRETALWSALTSLKAENTRADSPLSGKLDVSRAGLMGWSMGGGGTWLDAKAHPELKTAITMAGHDATAGGAGPLMGITVPTLMFAGTGDNAILGLAMSQPVYEGIPDTTPKMLYEVTDASHFDFNDPKFMNYVIGRYALAWQKVYLEGDMRYRKFLLEKGPMASDFRTNVM